MRMQEYTCTSIIFVFGEFIHWCAFQGQLSATKQKDKRINFFLKTKTMNMSAIHHTRLRWREQCFALKRAWYCTLPAPWGNASCPRLACLCILSCPLHQDLPIQLDLSASTADKWRPHFARRYGRGWVGSINNARPRPLWAPFQTVAFFCTVLLVSCFLFLWNRYEL